MGARGCKYWELVTMLPALVNVPEGGGDGTGGRGGGEGKAGVGKSGGEMCRHREEGRGTYAVGWSERYLGCA
jgi:hypothetical protein